MKTTNSNIIARFDTRIHKLESQLALAQDINLELTSDVEDFKRQYELAMKRIDYLESVILKLHEMVSEDITRQIKL